MTIQRKIEIGFLVMVLGLAGVFLKGWLLEREARIRADATAQASQQIIASKASDIKDRDAAAASYAANLAQVSASIKTPQQAAQVILKYLPAPTTSSSPGDVEKREIPTGVIPAIARADLPAATQAELPSAPTYNLLTDLQLKQIAQTELTCDADRNTLKTCRADKLDQTAQLAAAEQEAAAWKAAAKGGTKFQRFTHALKLIGCGAGGAAVGAIANKNSPSIGAPVGAAAGVTLCSIF